MATGRHQMRNALTIMFLLYAGLQLYGVAKARAGLALGWPMTAVLVAWVLLMTAMPLLIWRWEQRGWHRPVVIGSWVGYSWMGVAFLFFWIALAFDLLGVLLKFGDVNPELSVPDEFLLACALTAAVSIYGFVAARRLRVERVVLTSPKLPAGSDPLRIALISDVHLGALVGARRLRAILDKLHALNADVLVSAGDLVDGQADRLNGLAPMLAALQPRFGKFAVTGNHEYFVGLERALAFHERAGFRMLRGTAIDISDSVSIAGVDDPTGRSIGLAASTDEHSLLAGRAQNRYIILIKHQPRLDPRATGLFDLQLSGHVHRGQIFPFGLLVRLSYPLATGLSRIAGGGWLYVSRGTGTWGPPMRVLAAPEITLIELRPESTSTVRFIAP
jgi:predicted MPP superfamily phosphohydrolase